MLLHTGNTPVTSKNGLFTTIAASAPERSMPSTHSKEASSWPVPSCNGSSTSSASSRCRRNPSSSPRRPGHGRRLHRPRLHGSGCPLLEARGPRSHLRPYPPERIAPHIVRAALEAIAYQIHDLAGAMRADAGLKSGSSTSMVAPRKTTFSCNSKATYCKHQIQRP